MIVSDAVISKDQQFRYLLTRIWDASLPVINFIGLNPSTADAVEDDPTMRRCIAFAKSWGYGGLYMTNLFAYRTAHPDELRSAPDPVGPDNDMFLKRTGKKAAAVVFVWGVNGTYLNRNEKVLSFIRMGYCIAVSKDNHPRHPLYLKSTSKLKMYIGSGESQAKPASGKSVGKSSVGRNSTIRQRNKVVYKKEKSR